MKVVGSDTWISDLGPHEFGTWIVLDCFFLVPKKRDRNRVRNDMKVNNEAIHKTDFSSSFACGFGAVSTFALSAVGKWFSAPLPARYTSRYSHKPLEDCFCRVLQVVTSWRDPEVTFFRSLSDQFTLVNLRGLIRTLMRQQHHGRSEASNNVSPWSLDITLPKTNILAPEKGGSPDRRNQKHPRFRG